MKVAIYYRVSSKRQVEDDTIEAQKTNLPLWVKEKGWTLVKEYEDPGIGGWTIDRPELQQMLTDVRKGSYDAVVIRYFSRLIRDAAWDTLGAVMGAFEAGGCSIESPNDGSISSSDIVGKIMALVQAWSAQKDNEDKKVAICEGIEKAQKANKIVRTPLGIRWKEQEHKQGYYYIDQREHETLKKVISMLYDGHSLSAVIDLLNSDPAYKPRYSKSWIHGALWSLLQNDTLYHGMIRGKHALVKTRKSLFKRRDILKARACLTANRKLNDNGKKQVFSKNLFLLRRLVRCSCGAGKNGTNWRLSLQRQGIYPYYRCKGCGFGVRADHLDNVAWEKFKATLTDPEALKTAIMRESYLPSGRKQKDLEEMLQVYQENLKDIVAKKQRATDLYIDGEFDKDHLKQRIADLDREASKIKADLCRVENESRRPEELDQAILEATKAMAIEIAKLQPLEDLVVSYRMDGDRVYKVNSNTRGIELHNNIKKSEAVNNQKRKMLEQLVELGGTIVASKDKTLEIKSALDYSLFNLGTATFG